MRQIDRPKISLDRYIRVKFLCAMAGSGVSQQNCASPELNNFFKYSDPASDTISFGRSDSNNTKLL